MDTIVYIISAYNVCCNFSNFFQKCQTMNLHHEIRVLNIKDSYEVNVLNFVNKCLNGRCPDFLGNYFTYKQNAYNIREHQLKMAKYRTSTGSLSSKKIGPKLWNSLERCCIKSASCLSFKKTYN